MFLSSDSAAPKALGHVFTACGQSLLHRTITIIDLDRSIQSYLSMGVISMDDAAGKPCPVPVPCRRSINQAFAIVDPVGSLRDVIQIGRTTYRCLTQLKMEGWIHPRWTSIRYTELLSVVAATTLSSVLTNVKVVAKRSASWLAPTTSAGRSSSGQRCACDTRSAAAGLPAYRNS